MFINRETIFITCFFLAFLLVHIETNPDEKKLIKKLMVDYMPGVRPVRTPNKPLYVNMTYCIVTLQSINEKDQIANTFGWLKMRWMDEYLTWNTSEYPVTNLVLDSTKIWLPDFLIRNSIDDIYGELFGSTKYKAIVYPDGSVSYSTAGKSSTLCSLDMTYFPFDTQTCYIHIDSWSYIDNQVKIRKIMNKVNTSFYRFNGIWNLADTRIVEYTEDNSSQIMFLMYWKRLPLYHFSSILLPCSMMSLITLFVFLLPPDSGEKISLSITVLLSFTVFQISVEDKMPERSDNRPLIAIYILGTMMLTALSLLCTIIVLMLHHQNYHSPPPKWLKKFVLGWLWKFFFRKEPIVSTRSPVHTPAEKKLDIADDIFLTKSSKTQGVSFIGASSANDPRRPKIRVEIGDMCDSPPVEDDKLFASFGEMFPSNSLIPNFANDDSHSDDSTPIAITNGGPHRHSGTFFNLRKIRSQLGHRNKNHKRESKQEDNSKTCVDAILKKMMQDADTEEMKTEWMRIALVFDRVFGVLFSICIISLTIAIFVILSCAAPDVKEQID